MKKKEDFNQLANTLICISVIILIPYYTTDSSWFLCVVGKLPLSIGVIIFFIGIGIKIKNFKWSNNKKR